jgi:hypothetical protein
MFHHLIGFKAQTVGYGFYTDKVFMNDVVTGIPPRVDQLVIMDHLLKEQHSLGDIVKAEHSTMLDSIFFALDERVTGNDILSNQVILCSMNSVPPTCRGLARGGLGRSGRGRERAGVEDNGVGVPYEKREGYIRLFGQRGRGVRVPMS